jgi:DeoR family transcriptional regulator, aga operon transcriptional repressor
MRNAPESPRLPTLIATFMHQDRQEPLQPQDLVEHPVEPGLLVGERRHRILEILREQGRATVDDLANRFATSQVTIRTDLTALEATGALERTHGGALLRRDDDDQPIAVKQTRHHAEKVRIAQVAASLIQDGETIILDSGTTTAEIAKQIRRLDVQSVNVITNALNIATLLADAPSVRLIMLGGILRPESDSLSGHMAVAALANLQADRLFLGADGLDPERGVMTPHLPEAQLNAQMIAVSRQVIVVADSSKLMRRNISLIARVEQLHMVITDAGANPDVVAELERRGVEVRLA